MKRIALIILTTIYVVSCVGIGINSFYCCGKLASVTVNYGAETKQGNKKDCCRHEQHNFKVKDNHFNVASLVINYPVPALIPSFTPLDSGSAAVLLYNKIAYTGNAPPGHSDIPFYISNCAYRI